MLTFKCKVLFVTDEKKDLPIKDKNGVPTQLTKSYRFVTIQGMVKDPDLKCDRPVVIKSVDYVGDAPKQGDEFQTPEVRKYEIDNGMPVITI